MWQQGRLPKLINLDEEVSGFIRYRVIPGAEALSTPGKGGRRNQYLTQEQEKAFLETF